MKMKNYITGLVVSLILVTIPGCKGFLDEQLKSSLGPDNMYTSTYGFEMGVAGMYVVARDEFNTWSEGSAFYHDQACPYEALQIATDICEIGMGDGSLLPFGNLTLTAETQFVETYWRWSYTLIADANMVLEYSEKNENWDYPTDKQRFQAEARFFRAYAYRSLVYLYGDVPYVDQIEYDFKLNFTRDPKEEVLKNMVEDLKFACQYLPEDPDQVKDGKLTKWAAYHLLSEVYLMQKEYPLAAEAAQEVIGSGYYQLMRARFGASARQAGDVFYDMFVENNQNRKSGNLESIFVYQLEYNTQGGGTNSVDWSRRAWHPNYGGLSGFVIADTLGGRGLAQIIPMKWWMGTEGTNVTPTAPGIFDSSDIRNSEFNIKRSWYYNDPNNSSLYGNKCNITEDTWFSNNYLFPAIFKFFYGKEDNLTLSGSYKDKMKFRLAETYLLLAEACIGMGDAQGAADAINVVRARAGATLISAADATLDFLLDERIRELVGEETRRFTLVRTGKLIDRVKTYNDHLKDVIKDHHALWPVPQIVINANRDVVFPQNPGYGSN